MKRHSGLAVAAAGILCLTVPAFADDGAGRADNSRERTSILPSNGYFHLRAGANFVEGSDSSANNSPIFTGGTDFETGFTIDGALGTWFNNYSRAEIQVGYNDNEIEDGRPVSALVPVLIDGFVVLAPVTFTDQADMGVLTVMGNFYWEPDVGLPFRPFVGVGGGWAWFSVRDAALIDDNDNTWAAQARGGIAWPVSDRAEATLEYRYLRTGDPSFVDQAGMPFETEYASHAVQAGLRFEF